MEFSINYLAVAVSAIGAMVLGFLWYGALFGKQWMALSGFTKEEISKRGSPTTGYMLQTVGALVMAYVLAHFVEIAGAVTIGDALTLAMWAWLGFVAPIMLGTVTWDGKPWMLFALNAGYQLVNIAMMASILTLWV